MYKKVISLLLSFSIMFGIVYNPLLFSVSANNQIYTYIMDGYTVEYYVKNEWDMNQNIEVKITNTSSSPILNWAIKYNANGTINNIWNASIYKNDGMQYIIKNSGWNYEIEPNSSITFGYSLYGESLKTPTKFELCSKRIDITEGFDIEYKIINDWDTGFQGEIILTNISTFPLEAWTLSFNANFIIDEIWNGRIIEDYNDYYVIASQMWSNPIVQGSSVTLGFVATKSATTEAIANDFSVSIVLIDENLINDDIDWTNMTDSDADGLPDVYELYHFNTDPNNPDTDGDGIPDGYEVLTLGTDPALYDTSDEGKSDGEYDFDNDGLTNLQEYEYGTNPFISDTDYDGISDYDEIFIYNTDPLKFDSDNDGISDGDEILLGLDPNNSCTYGYPDNKYTVSQKLNSDDECLNKVNSTENIPFSISLELKSSGVASKNIIAKESKYSNVIKNEATLGIIPEFCYTNNLSVEDVVINFHMKDYAIANELGTYIDNSEFIGIKRLNIFKYFDDINMLLPVETFHDIATNRVYANVDELGTYCLMDMEIWLDSIGVSLDNQAELQYNINELKINEANRIDNELYNKNTISTLTTNKDDIDVIFVIDPSICTVEMNDSIHKMCERIFYESSNPRVKFIELLSSGYRDQSGNTIYYDTYTDSNLNEYFDVNNINELSKINFYGGYQGGIRNISSAIDSIVDEYANSLSRPVYVFSILDKDNTMFMYSPVNGVDSLSYLKDSSINVSVCSNASKEDFDMNKYTYISMLCKNSYGINVYGYDFYTDFIKHIYGDIDLSDINEYEMITSVGLKTIELDKPITPDYVELAKKSKYLDRETILKEYKEYADTDKDKLFDFEEINFDIGLISFDGNKVLLPTYGKCVNLKSKLTYVERGLNRFDDVVSNDKSFLDYVYTNVYVLPIKSDPTNPDSDGDTVDDVYDMNPLVPYLVLSDCIYEHDSTHSVSRHGLLADIDDEGVPVYRCLNCDEEFIPPEVQDVDLLNETEYAVVQAIYQVISQLSLDGDFTEDDHNKVESLYRIIDDIRLEKTSMNITFYDYADDYNINGIEGRRYVSPLTYKYLNAYDKTHKIRISIKQTTKLDLYEEELAKMTALFTLDTVVDIFTANSKLKIKMIYPVLNYLYTVEEHSWLSEGQKDNIVGIVTTVIDDRLEKYNLPISIGDVLFIGSVLNFSNEFKQLNDKFDNAYIPEYMYFTTIEIISENDDFVVFSLPCSFDYKGMITYYNLSAATSDSNLYNIDMFNTYSVLNDTYLTLLNKNPHTLYTYYDIIN